MRRTIFLSILLLMVLIVWGGSYYLFPPQKEEGTSNYEKPGIYAKKVHLKGRDKGNLSWEISADNLNIDLNYRKFLFEGNIDGKVYRDNKVSLHIKTGKAEVDRDKKIMKIPDRLYFETEDGYVGVAEEGVWYFDTGEFVSTKGRVRFEKKGEFKAEADIFRFDSKEGKADFEGNVVIEVLY
jgi:lipopolysaccharide export system protein LptA